MYSSGREKSSRQKRQKTAQKSAGEVNYIFLRTKFTGSGRKAKWNVQEEFTIDLVISIWETGNPLSKLDAYTYLIKEYGSDDPDVEPRDFGKAMGLSIVFIQSNCNAWFKRLLEKRRFTIRKESIFQSVPQDWMNIAISTAGIIRMKMSTANVTRLVNADKMFLQYYPKETMLIAPVNVKRVEANRKEDEKKSYIVMVSAEMFISQALPLFVIMTGKPDGYLARRYDDWNRVSTVCF